MDGREEEGGGLGGGLGEGKEACGGVGGGDVNLSSSYVLNRLAASTPYPRSSVSRVDLSIILRFSRNRCLRYPTYELSRRQSAEEEEEEGEKANIANTVTKRTFLTKQTRRSNKHSQPPRVIGME